MSKKQGRIPGIRMSPQENGRSAIDVPPDLEWPCTTHSCTHNTEHAPNCDGSCESTEWTQSQIALENLRREYARNNMSQVGIPEGVPVPIPGISVNLVDLLVRIITLEEFIFEIQGINREEYDELFRANKFEFLNTILQANKDAVRAQQTAAQLGIAKKSLLGPDGQPLGH